ncbi:MAG: hypothetical protein AAF384_06495 [Pseudomonadota bacterium]
MPENEFIEPTGMDAMAIRDLSLYLRSLTRWLFQFVVTARSPRLTKGDLVCGLSSRESHSKLNGADLRDHSAENKVTTSGTSSTISKVVTLLVLFAANAICAANELEAKHTKSLTRISQGILVSRSLAKRRMNDDLRQGRQLVDRAKRNLKTLEDSLLALNAPFGELQTKINTPSLVVQNGTVVTPMGLLGSEQPPSGRTASLLAYEVDPEPIAVLEDLEALAEPERQKREDAVGRAVAEVQGVLGALIAKPPLQDATGRGASTNMVATGRSNSMAPLENQLGKHLSDLQREITQRHGAGELTPAMVATLRRRISRQTRFAEVIAGAPPTIQTLTKHSGARAAR